MGTTARVTAAIAKDLRRQAEGKVTSLRRHEHSRGQLWTLANIGGKFMLTTRVGTPPTRGCLLTKSDTSAFRGIRPRKISFYMLSKLWQIFLLVRGLGKSDQRALAIYGNSTS